MTSPSSAAAQPEPIGNAAAALDAYEQHAFPGDPTSHRDGPVFADAAIRALLSDLMHYADHLGTDFRQALSAAEEIHAGEVAASRPYAVGDEVALRYGPDRCGTVVGTGRHLHTGQTIYHVHTPGEQQLRSLPAGQLAPAEPFGPTITGGTILKTASDAEQRLTELTATIHQAARDGGAAHAETYNDHHNLATALSAWSGTRIPDLLHTAATRAAAQAPREATEPPRPVQLAQSDYPQDITDALSQPCPGAARPTLFTSGQQLRASRP